MKANIKGAIPFVLLLIPYLIGISAGIYFPTQINVLSLYLCLTGLAILFVALNLLYSRWVYKAKWLGGLLIILLMTVAGLTNVNQSREINNSDHFSKIPAQNLLVKISSEPVWKNETLKFTAVVEEVISGKSRRQVMGNLLITIKSEAARKLYYGNELLIPAKYNEVIPPLNPAEFNYKQYLANKNIYHQAYLYTGQYVQLGHDAGNPIISYALRLRQRLVDKLNTNIHHKDAVAVAATLILGYKADLSNDILQAYSKTGTIHVLSVSGAHVGLVYLVLTFLLGFLNRYKYGRVIRAVLIIALVWFYALLTGFSPPVFRAAIMLSLIVTGKTYSRYINSLNILAFSALLLLLFDPLLITDVGFQLSYLAVAGLIVLQPIIYKWFNVKNKWLDKLWLLCSASIAAQVITFPLSAYYFHQIPVYFLISNLFILLPSALMMYGGIIYMLLPADFFLSRWLGYLLEQLILFTNKMLAFIEHAPLSVINKVWLTRVEYLLLYGIIALLFAYINKRSRILAGAGTGLLILFVVLLGIKRYDASSSNQMVFLSLRKHPGIVFRHGERAIVFTDVAADDKVFSYSIQPYLDSCKVNDLQVLNLSQNVKTTWLNKQGDLISFLTHKVAIISKNTPAGSVNNDQANYIYITGNRKIEAIPFDTRNANTVFVIDGSNSKALIKTVETGLIELNYKFKILTSNNALIVTSK